MHPQVASIIRNEIGAYAFTVKRDANTISIYGYQRPEGGILVWLALTWEGGARIADAPHPELLRDVFVCFVAVFGSLGVGGVPVSVRWELGVDEVGPIQVEGF